MYKSGGVRNAFYRNIIRFLAVRVNLKMARRNYFAYVNSVRVFVDKIIIIYGILFKNNVIHMSSLFIKLLSRAWGTWNLYDKTVDEKNDNRKEPPRRLLLYKIYI